MPARLCRDRDADTYRALFDIEAYLRLVVRWELRGNGGRSWAGALDPAVRSQAEARRTQESQDGIIDPLESGLLSYLHLSELKDVLVGSLWAKCSRHWRASLEIVKGEFKKLIAVRNKVAHFRPVTEWDAKVVSRFAEDLTRWTRPYRRIRELEVSWTRGAQPGADFVGVLRKYGVEALKNELEQAVVKPADELGVAVVGHHVAIRLRRGAGAFSPSRVAALIDREQDITVVRIGGFGSSVEFLVPVVSGADAIIRLVRGIGEAAQEVVEAISSDELVSAYGLDRHEGVLDESVTFPDGYDLGEVEVAR